jgi:O-antigen ligase
MVERALASASSESLTSTVVPPDLFRSWPRQAAMGSLVVLFFAFPVSVALANVMMGLTVLFWLMSMKRVAWAPFFSQAWRNPVVKPAVLLALLVVVAAAWSPASGPEIVGYFKKYSKFLILPVFISLLSDGTVRRRCWQGFALAMLITLVSTWLNVWTTLPWSRTMNQGFGVDHTVFKDHISQGIMMSLFVCLSAMWALKAPSRGRSVIWWVVCLLSVVSILGLSQGRTGYLGVFFAAVVFALAALGGRIKSALCTVTAAAMLFLVVYAVSPQFQHRTDLALKEAHTSSKSAVTSIGARIETWRFMTSSSTKMTLLGAGTGSYPVFAKTYFKDPAFCAVVCPHPHNQFLLFYFELGLVGLALFFWFIGTLVRRAFAVTLVHRGLILGFVAIMLVSNMTHSSLWLSTESHFFIFMTALLMASATPPRRTPADPGIQPAASSGEP